MSRNTLHQLYAEHTGKVSDKWSLYLNEYDRLFDDYRDKHVRLLEIGVQNGGSLEIWSKYFGNASALIGCDINPDCAHLTYDDSRIGIIIGDANAPNVCQKIFQHSAQFDIIIDDGSHLSNNIIKSFTLYFPRLAEGGIFIVEDLHCSYWSEFEGGLFNPYSSISFFKRLADVINHEHWGISKARADILHGIFTKYDCEIDAEVLSQVHSVEFVNSMCVVRKARAADNSLGPRIIAGSLELVISGYRKLDGSPPPIFDQSHNSWTTRDTPPDEVIQQTELSLQQTELSLQQTELSLQQTELSLQQTQLSLANAQCEIQLLKGAISALHNSKSWRVTAPMRALAESAGKLAGRLLRGHASHHGDRG